MYILKSTVNLAFVLIRMSDQRNPPLEADASETGITVLALYTLYDELILLLVVVCGLLHNLFL